MRQIRGVFQRIVRGKLRSGRQKVREGRLGVKAGVVDFVFFPELTYNKLIVDYAKDI